MRLAFVFFPLLLVACTSAQDRLHRIESGMLDLLGPAADLKITLGEGNLQLPLPPPLEMQEEQQKQARQLLADAAQIDSTALEPTARQQLRQYRRVLTDLSGSAAGWPIDPLAYTLHEPLQRCLAEADGESLAALLEKMPAYYTTLEQRWGHTNPRNLPAAVAQCLATLDRLEALENELGKYPPDSQLRLRAALPAAKAALKNYLGQCRSGVLEAG